MTKKNIDFEKSLSKLESIIEVLESENVSLEESVKKFEEGISLVKSCQKQLKDAELKVNKLLDDGSLEIVEYLSNLHMFWGARVRLGGLSVANRSTTSTCRRKPQPSLRSNHPSSCCGSGWTMAAGTTALNAPGNTF